MALVPSENIDKTPVRTIGDLIDLEGTFNRISQIIQLKNSSGDVTSQLLATMNAIQTRYNVNNNKQDYIFSMDSLIINAEEFQKGRISKEKLINELERLQVRTYVHPASKIKKYLVTAMFISGGYAVEQIYALFKATAYMLEFVVTIGASRPTYLARIALGAYETERIAIMNRYDTSFLKKLFGFKKLYDSGDSSIIARTYRSILNTFPEGSLKTTVDNLEKAVGTILTTINKVASEDVEGKAAAIGIDAKNLEKAFDAATVPAIEDASSAPSGFFSRIGNAISEFTSQSTFVVAGAVSAVGSTFESVSKRIAESTANAVRNGLVASIRAYDDVKHESPQVIATASNIITQIEALDATYKSFNKIVNALIILLLVICIVYFVCYMLQRRAFARSEARVLGFEKSRIQRAIEEARANRMVDEQPSIEELPDEEPSQQLQFGFSNKRFVKRRSGVKRRSTKKQSNRVVAKKRSKTQSKRVVVKKRSTKKQSKRVVVKKRSTKKQSKRVVVNKRSTKKQSKRR
jgi:hypothetical protein